MDIQTPKKEQQAAVGATERIRGLDRCVLIVTSVTVLTGIYWTFHFRWFGMMELCAYGFFLTSLLFPLVFLINPARKGQVREKIPIYDIILSLLSFAACFYFFLRAVEIGYGGWQSYAPFHAVIGGLILWLLVLEGLRRTVGSILVILVGVASIYPLFAGFMPGIFYGFQFSLPEIVGIHIFSGSGAWGLPILTFGQLVVGYLLFGVVMQFTGGATFFINLALALLGHVRGGPAKVSVVGSAFFGSMSGSALANVMVTGSFTIPAMKRLGFSSHYAAGVETCSSQGGQIMPPIMGVTAFVMADWLGMSYFHIALVGFIPALIYYVSLMVQVDGYAALHNLKGMPREELPSLWAVLKSGWAYIVGFGVLLFVMFKMLLIPQAPYIAVVALLISAMIRKQTRFTLKTFLGSLVHLGRVFADLVPVMCAVGMIISSFIFTGLATSVSSEILPAVEGNMLLIILATGVACIVMGTGMITVACYILGALLFAPALVHLGFPVLAVHFFIWYMTNLSGLTPPVCITAYAAAGLADAPSLKTGLTATRIGAILFIIPVFFLFRPGLLLIGTPLAIVVAVATALASSFMIASALEGYLVKVGRLSLVSRLPLGVGGLLFLFPGSVYVIIGIGLIVGAVVLALAARRM